jgi:hypothetical protein
LILRKVEVVDNIEGDEGMEDVNPKSFLRGFYYSLLPDVGQHVGMTS